MVYFFIKLLILLSLICMIMIMATKINEEFDSMFPPPIRVNIDTNKRKNRLILKWNNPQANIQKYFIILYKNNEGPYLITLPNININDSSFTYEIEDVSMNVDYKVAVVAYNDRKIFSKIENYTKAKLTPPGLQVEYVKDIESKITCNSDGSFTVKNSSNCTFEEDILQAKSIDNNQNPIDFNYDEHAQIMRELTYRPKLSLNF